ncbi:MAG: GTP-binding protein, partial [Gammaproteobacteria bacterium]|nr:GTP-binding protein [Gemmatimonadota bacterium]NIT88329.1 GTP-binding protein [Gemmatimonadota bacterium]NIU76063.1 GTP-binding protein [Gammaproteobacteria bacterium]NIX40570.1 GTP-binding protein [Gemmatimonadota bacterium]
MDWIPELARRADASVLVADLSDPGTGDAIEFILGHLEDR